MHRYVYFDSQIVTAHQTAISPVASAALYGKGVFTTIAINNARPSLWEKHWRRLRSNAERAAIDLSENTEAKTADALYEILEKNAVIDGRARITFFDGSAAKIWPTGVMSKTSVLIITGESHQMNVNFRLTISPYRVNSDSPLVGIKSCNYLDKILTLDEAKTRGSEEAVQVNELGEITSAAMANVFWLKDETLYTPSLKTGCLPGTTREFVMENMDCREVEETIDKLRVADAIFLTSAGLGVVQVGEFEGRKLSPLDHPILDLLPKGH